jgi:predicted transcriptional regulator
VKPRGNSWNLGAFLSSQLDDAGLDLAEFRVYLHLCRRANDEQRAWPAVPSIAKTCQVSDRTVQRALARLEDKGFITRQEQRRPDGSRTSDSIYLSGPPVTISHHPPTQSHQGGDSQSPHEGIPVEGVPENYLSSSSSSAVVPFKSEEEDKRAVTTRAHDLEQPYRARWFAAYQHPNARAAAISILKASPALWVSIAGLQGDTITHAQAFAGYLETFGLAAVQDAFTNSAQADPKGRAKYIKRCLENPIAQVGAVTVLPPVNIDDRKRQLQDELAAHFAELDKEFGLAAGGN